jgi:hypothetical protein
MSGLTVDWLKLIFGTSSGGTPIPSGLPFCSLYVLYFLYWSLEMVNAAAHLALKSNIGAAKSTGSAEKFVTCNGRVFRPFRLKSCWLGC